MSRRDAHKTATTALNENTDKAIALANRIASLLEEQRKAANAKPARCYNPQGGAAWGDAGDAGHAAEKLQELCDMLAGEGEFAETD